MYLKEMFLLSCRFGEVLRFNGFESLFNDKLTSFNLKIDFTSSVRVKIFLLSRISYLRRYFQDWFTSISVVATMLPIMVRPNAILKSEFLGNEHLGISHPTRKR